MPETMPKSVNRFNGAFDGDAPRFARHLAMNVDSMEELLDCKERLEDAGVEVLGVTDHEGIWQSSYFLTRTESGWS